MAKCTNITLIEHIDARTDVVQVDIDNEVAGLMLMQLSEALVFLNQDVIVEYRKDMYKGEVRTFVNTLTRIAVVNVLTRDSSVRKLRLYPEESVTHSTVCFTDIPEGGSIGDVTLYCCDVKMKSSPKANWAEFTMIDKTRRVGYVKLFSPVGNMEGFAGSYVRLDLMGTKYGYQTQRVSQTPGVYSINPDVDIAISFIKDAIQFNSPLKAFVDSTNMYEYMKDYIDYEPGYIAVRTAIELSLVDEISNMVASFDDVLVKQAIIASKCFVLRKDSKFSRQAISLVTLLSHKIDKQQETLLLLDENSRVESVERDIYNSVVTYADTLVKVKKGITVYHADELV